MRTRILTFIFISISFASFSQTYSISGSLKYPNNPLSILDSVWMYLNLNNTTIDSAMTDLSGNYQFSNVPNGSYTVTARTGKVWGGVNSTDDIHILWHFVGSQTFTSSLRMHSGDVDNSGCINATDAFKVFQRWTNNTSSFTRGDWVFEKLIGGDTLNVSPGLNDTIIVNGNNVNQDFHGECIGDVNGSFTPPLGMGTNFNPTVATNGTTSSQLGTVSIGSYAACTGSIISLPVNITGGFSRFGAVSLAIDYDGAVLSAIQTGTTSNFLINKNSGLTSTLISFAQTSKNSSVKQVKIAWLNSTPALIPDPNGVIRLFDLKFRYLGGNTTLTFDNSTLNGQNCEFVDSTGFPLIDTPSTVHYINGYVSYGVLQPGPITGNTTPCNSSTSVFSVPVDSLVTYTWSNTCGFTGTSSTNSISYTSTGNTGNISVVASNSCATSPATSFAITSVLTAPVLTTINGISSVCPFSTYGYSTNYFSGTTYTWTIPSSGGWTGFSSTNFISVQIGYSISFETINVQATNYCGTSQVISLMFDICEGINNNENNRFSVSNFPNPFSSTTEFEVYLPEPSSISAGIFNDLGELVMEIIASDCKSGKNVIAMDGSKLSPGIYIYKLTAISPRKTYLKSGTIQIIR